MKRYFVTAWAWVLLTSPLSGQVMVGELEERLRIGGIEGSRALTFVSSVAVTDDEVFIAQGQESLIRVLSKDGSSVRTIGGRGAGPGEFVGVEHLAIIDGQLVVGDPAQDRVTFLTPAGDVLATLRHPVLSPPTRPLVWVRYGSHYTVGERFIVATSTAHYDTEKVEEFPRFITTLEGDILDTVPGWFHRGGQRDMERTVFLAPIHWATRSSMAQDGRHFAVADGGDESVVIQVYDALTLKNTRVEVAVPARPVPAAYADSIARQWQESMSATGVGQLSFARFKRELDLPANAVGVEHLQVMPGGIVWFSEPNFGQAVRVWHVVNPFTGDWHRVTAPGDVVIMYAHGDEVWGRAMREFGVHYVVRLELAN